MEAPVSATAPGAAYRSMFLGMAGGSVLSLSATAFAADEAVRDSRFELGAIDFVVVRDSRLTDWNAPITSRIDAEDLRRFDRQDVSEAVNLLPGTSIQNVGGRSERLLFVRGFNSRQVPLFIDGIPVYVPYDGNVDLGRFTTFDLAEIAVTKSLTSMLYGANTLGGSVNLVSRRPVAELEASGGVGTTFDDAGDASQHRAWFNGGTNQGTWYLQAGGSWLDRNHFRLPDDFDPMPSETGGRRDNSEAEDRKVNLKLGLTPNATDEYALSYINQQGEKQTPPYAGDTAGVRPRFWQWPEWDKESVYFISKTAFGGAHHVKLRAFYDTFDNTLRSFDDATYTTQFRPFAFNSVYDDYTYGGAIELGTDVYAGHALRTAFHYKRDIHRETDSDNSPEERYEDEVLSFGLEDTIAVGSRWTLIAGTSWDRQKGIRADNLVGTTITPFPTDTESALNLQGGAIFAMSEADRLRLSLSRRTRFPTIKDRYSFRLGSALPNPSLKPEEASHFELGIDGQRGPWEYGANVFYSELTDAIENVTLGPTLCAVPPCFQLQNIGKQRNRGVELVGGARFGDAWRLHANYTFLDRENESAPAILSIDVPEHKFFAFAQYSPADAWEFVASLQYEDNRFSTTTGDRTADDFVLGNLKASWHGLPHLTAAVGVNNIGDTHYEYEEGFPEAGRTWFVNLQVDY